MNPAWPLRTGAGVLAAAAALRTSYCCRMRSARRCSWIISSEHRARRHPRMFRLTLLEMAVKSQPKLTPVLRWRRVRCARAAHVVAGAGRVRKMRESLRNRFEV